VPVVPWQAVHGLVAFVHGLRLAGTHGGAGGIEKRLFGKSSKPLLLLHWHPCQRCLVGRRGCDSDATGLMISFVPFHVIVLFDPLQ
jgi:hypothetical protein